MTRVVHLGICANKLHMPFHTTLNLLDLAELALAVHFALEKVEKNMCIILQKLAHNTYVFTNFMDHIRVFLPFTSGSNEKKKYIS